MKRQLTSIAAATLLAASATGAFASITMYADAQYYGPVITVDAPVNNLRRLNFNDRVSSITVESGRWEVCSDAGYAGRCVVLRRGSYPSLAQFGLNDQVSSVRPLSRNVSNRGEVYEAEPQPIYEYRRRPSERLYSAEVIDARAVYESQERRCWTERQRAESYSSGNNVGGAIAGAIIGGIIGHQIGGGRGQDIATAGGAVAGAAIGSNANGGRNYRDVERCENAVSGAPTYWDVRYRFRGVEHSAQMTQPPGRTIAVNGDGVPRL